MVWINQPNPTGFGDAVLRGRTAIGDDNFLVHAGDTYIVPSNKTHYRRLLEVFEGKKADAAFLVKKMQNTRYRGIIEGQRIGDSLYAVKRMEEKPEIPFSDLAIEPVYLFKKTIFESLEQTKPGRNSEVQLTDAIQRLVMSNKPVYAVELLPSDLRLDIGSPQSYWETLRDSYYFVTKSNKPA